MANKHGQRGSPSGSQHEGSSTRLRDTRYLEKHQDLWRCVVGYRRDGKVIKLRRSLGTSSLREAQHRRWAVIAALKASITTAATDDAE